MRNFAVIGFPVKHSFSPDYFTKKFEEEAISDASYTAIEIEDIRDIRQIIKTHNLTGFNVTIPHKQSIIAYLDSLSEAARVIGAVNTIVVKNGKLHGDNTDFIGFRKSISQLIKADTKALIFGTGGSSLAVKYALTQMGILHSSVSRGNLADFTYGELTAGDIGEHKLLINTTPLGLPPNVKESVEIPYHGIGEKHLCYDLIYTPEETEFLSKAKAHGAKIKNGVQMLEIQADEAWKIWNS